MLQDASKAAGDFQAPALSLVGRLGAMVWQQWRELRHAAAVVGTAIWTCAQPRLWTRPVRAALARQIVAIGVEPLWFVAALAAFVGLSVVVQLTFWIGEAGQSRSLGPLLVTVVARELGPLLINLVVIVRSGSALTTELGFLKITGEVHALEARGGDPFLQLVVPRVLGMAVATFCLTIVFILVAFTTGFVFAAWMGMGSRDPWLFANSISGAIQMKDLFNILAKGLLPALFVSVTCCLGGLAVDDSAASIPPATQRALTRSVAGLIVISAGVSLLTYF